MTFAKSGSGGSMECDPEDKLTNISVAGEVENIEHVMEVGTAPQDSRGDCDVMGQQRGGCDTPEWQRGGCDTWGRQRGG